MSVPTAALVIHVPFVLFVFTVAFFTLWHEHSLIKKYLATEAAPVLHPGEMKRLMPATRRGFHTMLLFFSFKFGPWATRRKRNKMLIKLAFEKWHMDQEHASKKHLEGHYHATRVLDLREKLTALQPLDLS